MNLVSVIFSVLGRRTAPALTEYSVERRDALKSCAVGDFGHVQIGVDEELLSHSDALEI